MNIQYVFAPKNPILWHCGDSFFNVLSQRKNQQQDGNISVEYVPDVNAKNAWLFICKLLNAPSKSTTSLFLLAVQTDYLVLAFLLRFISKLWQRELNIYYLMHEPRLEQGRVDFIKTFIINTCQVLFAYIADKVMLPSPEAVCQAKAFVPTAKIHSVNLVFASIPDETLKQNLQQLKSSWNSCKNFLMLGTVSSIDKNPQGFVDFSAVVESTFPNQAKFIRAGRDRNVQVAYDEQRIIQFSNYLSNPTKAFIFGLSHFVVIPYTASTQSGVIAEALSYGKLLVLNNIPAFSHLRNCSFAFIVDFSDQKSILGCAETLFSLTESDYERRYWDAVQYFSNHYSETQLAQSIKNLFD